MFLVDVGITNVIAYLFKDFLMQPFFGVLIDKIYDIPPHLSFPSVYSDINIEF
jgi:hypothetical protein